MLAREVNGRVADGGSPFFSLEFFPPPTIKNQPTPPANHPNGLVVNGAVPKLTNGFLNQNPLVPAKSPTTTTTAATTVDEAATLGEVRKFVDTLRHLNEAHPLFVDVTWFMRNDPGNLAVANSSTAIAVLLRREVGLPNVMLHLTCNGFPAERTKHYLRQAVANGVNNILALRGDDPPKEAKLSAAEVEAISKNGYWARDLVEWCRELPRSRKEVTVVVAGDPLGHPLCEDYHQHLRHLREKVDAGADFIVTQFFLEVAVFERFLSDCRRVGIHVPIIPGVLLFKNAGSLQRIAKISGVPIPDGMAAVLEENKKNAAVVQNFALHHAFGMCREMLERGLTKGIHLFTMNQREHSGLLLRRLGLWQRLETYEQRCLLAPLIVDNVEHSRYFYASIVKEQQQRAARKVPIVNTVEPTPLPVVPKSAELLELDSLLIEATLAAQRARSKETTTPKSLEERGGLMMSFWLEWLQERPATAVKGQGENTATNRFYSAVSPQISTTFVLNPLHMR